MHPDQMDPFADALEFYLKSGRSDLFLKRDDGYVSRENVGWYLTSYPHFPIIEKRALRYARGRILDVGCGAGRHSLYLQSKGHKVTALDSSAKVAGIASSRGVRDVVVAEACSNLPFTAGKFDTVLLLGNNLGICGSFGRVSRMLVELSQVTARGGRILATSRAPGMSKDKHRAYWESGLSRGEEIGVVHLELSFKRKSKKWMTLLLISPDALLKLAWNSGWRIAELFCEKHPEDGYAVVLEKR